MRKNISRKSIHQYLIIWKDGREEIIAGTSKHNALLNANYTRYKIKKEAVSCTKQ